MKNGKSQGLAKNSVCFFDEFGIHLLQYFNYSVSVVELSVSYSQAVTKRKH